MAYSTRPGRADCQVCVDTIGLCARWRARVPESHASIHRMAILTLSPLTKRPIHPYAIPTKNRRRIFAFLTRRILASQPMTASNDTFIIGAN
jgi:hypothetical protein